jgi:hypothetical protein
MVRVAIDVVGLAAASVAVAGVVVRSGSGVNVAGGVSVEPGIGVDSTNVMGVSVATNISVGGADVIVG